MLTKNCYSVPHPDASFYVNYKRELFSYIIEQHPRLLRDMILVGVQYNTRIQFYFRTKLY